MSDNVQNQLEIKALMVLYDDALAKAIANKNHDDKVWWVGRAIGYADTIKELKG